MFGSMGHVVQDPGKAGDLKSSHFGENTDAGLELSPVEHAYLVEEDRLDGDFERILTEEAGEGFEAEYLVYRDFRSRGFYVKPGGEAADFLVYPRGKGPGEAPAKFLVHAVSERRELPLRELLDWVGEASNLNRRAVVSTVDEEGDVTHYEASRTEPEGEAEEKEYRSQGRLLGDRAVTTEEGFHGEEFYGQPLGDLVQLSLVEAHHLLREGRLDLGIPDEEFLERARAAEGEFDEKSRLYRDLRGRGVVPKTGFKFGSHFRTYSYFDGLEDFPHAENLVHAHDPGHVFDPPELSRAVRLAQSVKKRMLFAVLGDEVEYLEVGRIRP